VVKAGVATGVRGLVNGDNSASGQRQAQYLRWNANTLESLSFYGATAAVTATKTGGTSTNRNVLSAKRTATNLTAYLNGAAGTPVASSAGNALTIFLGLNASGNAFAQAGNVHYGEVALYSGAHDDTTRQAIEAALAAAYGITL
jgi:hypothetical protein